MKNRIIYIYIPFILIILSLVIPFLMKKDFNANYRLIFNYEFILELIDSYENNKPFPLSCNDDIGFPLVFTMGIIFNGLPLNFNITNGAAYPGFVICFFLFFHSVSIIALVQFFRDKLPVKLIYILLVFILYIENFNFIAFSSDVYYFPFYAFCWFLLLVDSLKKNKSITNIILISIMISLCEWFRAKSVHGILLCLFVALLFRIDLKIKNSILTKIFYGQKRLIVALTTIILVAALPKVIFKQSSHVFWHSLYTGIYQFGGIVLKDNYGENGKYFPSNFLKIKVDQSMIEKKIDHWSDEWTYEFVNEKNPKIQKFSIEYDLTLKNQILKLLIYNPVFFIELFGKRFLDLMDIYPLKQHDKSSYSISSPIRGILYILLLVLIFFLLFKYPVMNIIDKDYIYIVLFMLFYFALPPLLVHSGTIMYNLPFQIILNCILIIIFYQFLSLFLKRSFKHKN